MEPNDKLEQLLKKMYAQESLYDDKIDTSDIIDEEWTKFEAENFPSTSEAAEPSSGIVSERSPFLKIAAMFIGVLMLSGITYAAVQIFSSSSQRTVTQQTEAIANTEEQKSNHELVGQDSTLAKPVVFEDAELGEILRQMASFYQVELVYKKKESQHIRLFFTWDKQQSLDDIIDTFNKFERIHMTRDNQKLIVE